MFDIENYRHLIIGVTNDIRACAYIRPYISHVKLRTDCVNCFGKRYRENRNFRSVGTDGVMTDISPLRLRTYGYPCKMCSASVFVVKFKIYTRKRFNARINVVRISNMMGDDGIARSWKSDWEPNSGIVVSIASDDNSPLQIENRPAGA